MCDEHLLTEYVPGRYTLHDLLRAYAAEEAQLRESEADRRAAMHRVLDHYLHAANMASCFLYPRPVQLTLGQPMAGVMPEEIVGPGQAAEWFENERHVLLAVIDQAAERRLRSVRLGTTHAAGRTSRARRTGEGSRWPRNPPWLVADELGDLAGQVMAR